MTPGDSGVPGQGDKKIQAYCFRLCLTNNASNAMPFTEPPTGYNASMFELLRRYIALSKSTSVGDFIALTAVGESKIDGNNRLLI